MKDVDVSLGVFRVYLKGLSCSYSTLVDVPPLILCEEQYFI
jgi:hypothetical protein